MKLKAEMCGGTTRMDVISKLCTDVPSFAIKYLYVKKPIRHPLAIAISEHPVVMASKLIATGCALLLILSLCESQSLHQKTSATSNTTLSITPGGHHISSLCAPRDIGTNQFEISGVGLPTWQVEITSSCTNPRCSISHLVVQCGEFHSGPDGINPRVFRRLDLRQGTCIVNDGRRLANAGTIVFQYQELWEQPLRLRCARVPCQT